MTARASTASVVVVRLCKRADEGSPLGREYATDEGKEMKGRTNQGSARARRQGRREHVTHEGRVVRTVGETKDLPERDTKAGLRGRMKLTAAM